MEEDLRIEMSKVYQKEVFSARKQGTGGECTNNLESGI